MKESLAAVFAGVPGEIALRTVSVPAVRPGEALVRVLGCTLCGSDLHSFDGRRSVPVPTVLGHEIVGEIVELGAPSPLELTGSGLRAGDRVTWAIVAHCGNCYFCQTGLPQKCLNGVKYGHEAFQPGRELVGGLAEFCLLVAGTSIVRLPDDLPLTVACPASCATATIAAAIEAAGDLAGRSVLLSGAGLLGLTACAMARSLGAERIVSVDPSVVRQEWAQRFGATYVCTPADLSQRAAEWAGRFGFDVAIELSGSSAACLAAFERVRVGGTVVFVGAVFPGEPLALVPEQIVRRQLTIRGIHNYSPRHLVAAVDFLSRHHQTFPFDRLVTGWLPLNEVAEAFAAGRDGAAIRIGVGPGDRVGKRAGA